MLREHFPQVCCLLVSESKPGWWWCHLQAILCIISKLFLRFASVTLNEAKQSHLNSHRNERRNVKNKLFQITHNIFLAFIQNEENDSMFLDFCLHPFLNSNKQWFHADYSSMKETDSGSALPTYGFYLKEFRIWTLYLRWKLFSDHCLLLGR